jgi:hypothetical protein
MLSWRAARLNQRAKLQRLSLVRPLARASRLASGCLTITPVSAAL